MFFFLAVLAMLAYAIQGTLMVHHARQMDGISATMYRSVSLVFTLLPLLAYGLWRTPSINLETLEPFWWDFLVAGSTGAVSSVFAFWSIRFIPAAVGNIFRRVGGVVFAFFVGYWWFAEIPLWKELFFVAFILFGAVFLSFQKKDFDHLDNNAAKGILLSIISAIFAALTFASISKISRAIDPLVAGYIWEALVAVFAVFIGLGRQGLGGQKITKISWPDFWQIALVCSPTLIGTGAFLTAVTLGPFGIVSAIGAGGVLVTLLMSHWLYHEKLTTKQWVWIMFIAVGIAGIKLVGN